MTPVLRRQLFAFATIGTLATLVQYAVLAVLVEVLAIHPVASSAAGFVCGALLNYRLNHRLTFGGTARHGRALPRFVIVAIVGLGLNSSIMALCYAALGLHYFVAQVVATAIVFVWSFTGNRLWSFQ